ncbi:MAG: hypothetical protein GWN93_27030 [Deltaproteobacteria bacterium]|nr:hypothetical protein [Deltaproteobacteria bacterium]
MQIIIKKRDGGVLIIKPNAKKFGPERKEVMKEVTHEVHVLREDEETGLTYVAKEEVVTAVVDRVIRPYSESSGLQRYINPDHVNFVGEIHEWFLYDGEIDKSDLESRKQLYWEGDEIKKDYAWEKRLMPNQLIKRKHIKRLRKKVGDELARTSPNPIDAIAKLLELDECRIEKAGTSNEELFWVEKAVANLDEDGHDKPEIRKKLQDKIKELKNGGQ